MRKVIELRISLNNYSQRSRLSPVGGVGDADLSA